MQIPGYRILRTIGKGAAAVAYLAQPAQSTAPVVLKVLHQHTGDEGGTAADTRTTSATGSPRRLAQEASLVAALDHVNIVRIQDAGEWDRIGYIAMEYLAGGDLEMRIGAGMDVRQCLDVAHAVASALAYAHERGIVHRDVKPQNILFRADGTPVLSDFGVAKRLDQDLKLTVEGISIGSPLYMSPEQAKGEEVDGRTDIYSLGVVLFEMLTGSPPFDGESSLAVILKHLHGDVPRLPAELAGFQRLLDLMLAKDPGQRLGSAQRLAALLAQYRDRLRDAGSAPAGPAAGRFGGAAEDEIPPTLLAHLRAGIQEDLEYDRLILPALPEVAVKVRHAVADGSVSVRDIARLIAVDPAVSAQVMKVANSAFYPGRTPVTDLTTAVVRLGGDTVRNLVMVIVAAQLFQAKQSRELSGRLKQVWEHSVLVAGLSRAIAHIADKLDPDVALLGGLVHKIGVLPVLEWAIKIPHFHHHPARLDRLVERFHAEIGTTILARWNYPEVFLRVVAGHEDEAGADREGGYVSVVAVANRLAAEHPDETDHELLASRRYTLNGRDLAVDTVARLLDQGRAGAEELLAVLRG